MRHIRQQQQDERNERMRYLLKQGIPASVISQRTGICVKTVYKAKKLMAQQNLLPKL